MIWWRRHRRLRRPDPGTAADERVTGAITASDAAMEALLAEARGADHRVLDRLRQEWRDGSELVETLLCTGHGTT